MLDEAEATERALRLDACRCGGMPKFRCTQVAEDLEESWVECPKCGLQTEPREGAYCDFASSAWDWNAGDMQILKPERV